MPDWPAPFSPQHLMTVGMFMRLISAHVWLLPAVSVASKHDVIATPAPAKLALSRTPRTRWKAMKSPHNRD